MSFTLHYRKGADRHAESFETLNEALRAADILVRDGICFNLQIFEGDTLLLQPDEIVLELARLS